MLVATQDDEQIIERIAALDIGKAEVACCVRVPGPPGSGKRLQDVRGHEKVPTGGQVTNQDRSADLAGRNGQDPPTRYHLRAAAYETP